MDDILEKLLTLPFVERRDGGGGHHLGGGDGLGGEGRQVPADDTQRGCHDVEDDVKTRNESTVDFLCNTRESVVQLKRSALSVDRRERE